MKARLFSVLAAMGAAAATALSFGVGAASAMNHIVNCPGGSGNLQSVIDGAGFGDTITIYGTCYGNYSIAFKTLTVQGGAAGATLNGTGSGTTLRIEGSVVSIRNLAIVNGNGGDGGGLNVFDSTLTMTNSTVKGNRADFGGGIFAEGFSILDLTGVTVTRNTASYQGGGIDVLESSLTMTASTVSNNASTELGLAYGGGGIWMLGSGVVLTSTKVTTNRSADYGGGIADYGGCLTTTAPPTVPSQGIICLVNGGGGGVAAGRAIVGRAAPAVIVQGLTLVNSSVDHNVAADDGGGIYNESEFDDSPVVLQGTTVSFNNAVDGDGGGIANYGFCGNTASLLATKSTFQGNLATNGDGGAIYNASGDHVCEPGIALTTIAQSPVATGPNVVNSNQARRGGGIANEQSDGVSSVTLQPGATVRGNKASVTGGGVWNNCGSFSSLGQIFLNTPNNVVQTCVL